MKCGLPVECRKLEELHDGCVIAASRRNVSPSSKQILALLARQAKIALDHGQTDYDREAFLREVEDIDTVTTYMGKREANEKTLESYDHLSQMGDYAGVLCKELKMVKGVSFKEMYWIQIVARLDGEM